MLELDIRRASYGQKQVLENIDVTLSSGWTSVIGPNGSGKTSLLRSILGQLDSDGSIYWEGNDLTSLDVGQTVSYLPQSLNRPKGMSVGEYVLLGRVAHLGLLQIPKANDRQIAEDAIDLVGASHLSGRSVTSLSGGEMQRIGFARSLCQETPVMLLDEFTSSLDIGAVVSQSVLQQELIASRELTVLAAMHDLGLAARFSDNVVLLNQGRVVDYGPPDQVMTESALGELYQTDIRLAVGQDGYTSIYAV